MKEKKINKDLEPNFTQIPNAILDNMQKLNPYEITAIMYICRKTYGWHKIVDKISLSQFMEGTSIKKTTLISTLASLQEKQIVIVIKNSRKTNEYMINTDCDWFGDDETGLPSQKNEPEPSPKSDLEASIPSPSHELHKKEVVRHTVKGSPSHELDLPFASPSHGHTKEKNINKLNKRKIAAKPPSLQTELKNYFVQNVNQKYYFDGKEAGILANIIKRINYTGVDPLLEFKDRIRIFEELKKLDTFWSGMEITLGTILSQWNKLTQENVNGKINKASGRTSPGQVASPKITQNKNSTQQFSDKSIAIYNDILRSYKIAEPDLKIWFKAKRVLENNIKQPFFNKFIGNIFPVGFHKESIHIITKSKQIESHIKNRYMTEINTAFEKSLGRKINITILNAEDFQAKIRN